MHLAIVASKLFIRVASIVVSSGVVNDCKNEDRNKEGEQPGATS
jgi:hypothetical protein